MTTVVLLATAWGPKAGGINTFNMELSSGLHEVLGDGRNVICVVPSADAATEKSAQASGVTLVSLGIERAKLPDSFDVGWTERALSRLHKQGIKTVDIYIGHDVVSGEVANAMRDETEGARAAILMHMSYSDYQAVKHGSGQEAHEKHEHQAAIFERADVMLGVGPLLRDRARDLAGDPVTMLVPGLPSIQPRPPMSRLVALSFGRFEAKNDRIKQIRLAVEGVAEACQRGQTVGMPTLLKDNPMLKLIGVAGDPKEERSLQQFAQQVAKRIVNLHALPYEEDRQKLLRHIAEANLSLMLSWHEGFGLTGWESIAGEVPLVVSEQTGLYRLLTEFNLEGFVFPVAVDGSLGDPEDVDAANFTDDDRRRVAERIVEIVADIEKARGKAQALKRALTERGFTWARAARTLLEAAKSPRTRPGAPIWKEAALILEVAPATGSLISGPPEDDLLDPKERAWPADRGVPPDSVILRPEYRFVPFHELRRVLLNQLADIWAQDPEPWISVRLQIGAGGSGKTRLAVELAALLRRNGWRAGFLRERADTSRLTALFANGHDTLVVIDYAETRRRDLFATVRAALSARKAGQRIRVLMLARTAGDWWDRLAEEAGDAEVAAILKSFAHTIGPYALPTLVLEGDERASVYREALTAFVERLAPAATVGPEPSLAADHFAEPLFVHLAALCAVRGQRLSAAHDMLDSALMHEREYWKRALDGVDLQGAGMDGVEQVVALATLVGGTGSTAEARRAVVSVPRLRGLAPVQHDRVLDAVRMLYPLRGGLDALRPDLLGERLVYRALFHDDSLLDVVFGASASEQWIRSALTVLTRLARSGGNEATWLLHAFEGERLQRNALHAMHVAVEAGDPLPHLLSKALMAASPEEQRELIPKLNLALPDETTALQDVAVSVAQIRLNLSASTGGGKKARLERIIAYHHLSSRLLFAGQAQQARIAAETALDLADRSGGQELVARILTTLTAILAALGAYDERLQCAERAERLAREFSRGKDTIALAGSLINLANALVDVGEYERALQRGIEAEQAWWKASTLDADEVDNWAKALANLALYFLATGKRAEAVNYAQRAEKTYRELAQKQPDAYLPSWAWACYNLVPPLMHAGRYSEALACARDAEETLHRLAEARPTAYRSRWATAARLLAECLGAIGHISEALTLARQAEQVFLNGGADHTEKYQRPLAASRDAIAGQLFEVDDFEQSLEWRTRAVELWRELATKFPRANRNSLAVSLFGLAEVSSRLGRHQDAIALAEEANAIVIDLITRLPAAYAEVAAGGRVVLAEARFGTGDLPGAFNDAEASLDMFKKVEFPSTTADMRARALALIARVHQAHGAHERALDAARQAAKILSDERRNRPAALVRLGREVDDLCAHITLSVDPTAKVAAAAES